MRRLLPLILLLPSCLPTDGTRMRPKPSVVVDVSERRMFVDGTPYRASTARRGTGNVPGSKKTPIGTFVVVDKWTWGDPDYHGRISGPKLHLAGADCPASRRIYVHKGKTSGNYSLGCVHLSERDMHDVFAKVPVGSRVEIRP